MSKPWITPVSDEGDAHIATDWQRRRVHAFVQKRFRRLTPKSRFMATSKNMTVDEFSELYSAAEFALEYNLTLDMHVTIHFGMLGFLEAADVQRELTRFLKCYHAYNVSRGVPVAWMYAIEMHERRGELSYHAHIPLYVPGWFEGSTYDPRKLFRSWIRGYCERQYGRHIPKAIRVTGGRKERLFGHWNAVTYLMKGYQRDAIVQSRKRTPDGLDLFLGDLIPWPYVAPGPVALRRRIAVSQSLSAAQRAIGAPTGMEYLLPQQPNWEGFTVDRVPPREEMDRRVHTKHKAALFRSKFEDGVRDVRQLYPKDFYEFVVRPAFG